MMTFLLLFLFTRPPLRWPPRRLSSRDLHQRQKPGEMKIIFKLILVFFIHKIVGFWFLIHRSLVTSSHDLSWSFTCQSPESDGWRRPKGTFVTHIQIILRSRFWKKCFGRSQTFGALQQRKLYLRYFLHLHKTLNFQMRQNLQPNKRCTLEMPRSHLYFPITSSNKQPLSSSSLLVNILLLLSFNFLLNVGLLRTTTEKVLLRTTTENSLLHLFRMIWRLVDRPPAAPLTHRVEGSLQVGIDQSLDQIETGDNNNNSIKTDLSNYTCLEWWWSPSRREGGGEEVLVQGLRQIHFDLGTRLEQAIGHLEVRICNPGPLALTVPHKVLPPRKSSRFTLFYVIVCSTPSHAYFSIVICSPCWRREGRVRDTSDISTTLTKRLAHLVFKELNMLSFIFAVQDSSKSNLVTHSLID